MKSFQEDVNWGLNEHQLQDADEKPHRAKHFNCTQQQHTLEESFQTHSQTPCVSRHLCDEKAFLEREGKGGLRSVQGQDNSGLVQLSGA